MSVFQKYANSLGRLGIVPAADSTAIIPDGSGAIPCTLTWRIAQASVPVAAGGTFRWLSQAQVQAPASLISMIGYASDAAPWSLLVQDVSVGLPGIYTEAQAQALIDAYQVAFAQGNNRRWLAMADCGYAGGFQAGLAATTVAATTIQGVSGQGTLSKGLGAFSFEGAGLPLQPQVDAAGCIVECVRAHGVTIGAQGLTVTIRGVAFRDTDIPAPGSGNDSGCGSVSSSQVVDTIRNARSSAAHVATRLK